MSANYCMDASAFIAAWNVSHPIDVFPSLWSQLVNRRDDMVLIKPIFDEIDPIKDRSKTDKYSLRMWMISKQFKSIPVDFIEDRALELERKYQIRNNSKGVGRNDLKLIAYAKLCRKTVVTEEGKQPGKPVNLKKNTIPKFPWYVKNKE